jgi:hypothetical protein
LRNVNDLWVGGLNHNHLGTALRRRGDLLVFVAVQRPVCIGCLPQLLNRSHYFRLIGFECGSKGGIIIDVRRHHV